MEKRRFAAHHGFSTRTAHRHLLADSELWRNFRGRTEPGAAPKMETIVSKPRKGKPATVAPMKVLTADILPPAVASIPDAELCEHALMVKAHWGIWWHASQSWQAAIQRQDEYAAVQFGQVIIKAMEAYYKAKAAYEQHELDEREKFPASDLAELRTEFFIPLGNMLRHLPFQLAPAVNPLDIPHAIKAGTEYMLAHVQPEIDRLLDAMEAKQKPSP
jgi:hypothetical protein